MLKIVYNQQASVKNVIITVSKYIIVISVSLYTKQMK